MEYAPPPGKDVGRFAGYMRTWRWVAFWCVPAIVLGLFTKSAWAVLVSTAAFSIATVLTLFYMTLTAYYEVDCGYAIRHLLLAIALCPFMLLGLFLIPSLVQTDIEKWREKVE